MSWAAARAGPYKRVGCLRRGVDVVMAVAVVHQMLCGYGSGRPVKTRGQPHWQGRAARVEPTSHGPRPGPAHHIFKNCRPCPAPTQPITMSKPSAPPGQ